MVKISRARVDLETGRVDNAALKGFGETLVGGSSGTNTGSAYTVDISTGNAFNLILNANCTFTFSNPFASGTATSFTLILTQDSTGNRTVTWPTSVVWPGGAAPGLSGLPNRIDTFRFFTVNGGTTWYGSTSGMNMVRQHSQLFSWGDNAHGELGLGDAVTRSSPVFVSSATGWSVIAGGYYHTLAIKTDGTLWAWGKNDVGQLGLGDTAYRSSPAQVGALTTWASVTGGGGHTLAVDTAGKLWAWGSNSAGQLGVNLATSANTSSPTQVGALTTWASVAAGHYHSLAVKTTGQLFSWGKNDVGQLGANLAPAAYRSSPVQVGALATWKTPQAFGPLSGALKVDGTLWTWGLGTSGQLGNGLAASASSPVQVGTGSWQALTVGYDHMLAVQNTGALLSWGLNAYGQLGAGDTTARSSPVAVGSLTSWSKVAAGVRFSTAVRGDGSLFAWGRSNFGQLGQNDGATRSSPTQVGSAVSWNTPQSGAFHTVVIT